ncbi:MAG: HAMP domain-containing sensor histidine kinase [Chryseolinea sp.]
MRNYLFIFLLICSVPVFAQQERIDSLMSEIRQNTIEKTEMELMMAEARVYRQNLIIGLGVVLSLFGASITVLLYQSYKRIRKRNLLLNVQNREIHSQSEEIFAQNEEITLQTEHLKVNNDFLEHQNRKLIEINNEREALISIVAHDLRSPINRSKGLAKILLHSQITDEQRGILNLLLQVNEEGSQIITDILQTDSSSYTKPASTPIHLRQFISDHIEKVFQEQALKKNILINITIDDDLHISTDAVSFRRIIDNLISNALKFSNLNSTVFIKVISVDDAVYISIQDQGPGISEEDQKKMFKRFQKLSAQPTFGESSTGLGLAIVKGLVERLKGEIQVKTELGVGTEFVIRMNKETKLNLRLSSSPSPKERAIESVYSPSDRVYL